MPSSIEQVHQEYGERGLTIVAIDIREPPGTVAAWVDQHLTSFPVLLDADGRVARQYAVTATPTVFLVSRDGRLLGKALGPKPWTSERGRALLGALLRS